MGQVSLKISIQFINRAWLFDESWSFRKKPHQSPLIQGEQEIKCLVTIENESGVWRKLSVLKEFLNSNYDFENRDSDDWISIIKEIENKMNTTLDTIPSDEVLVEIDHEDIWFNSIALFWIWKSVRFFPFKWSKLPESKVLKINKVSKNGGAIKIWSVKIYGHLIKVKFVFITLIKWYLNFV